MMSKSESPTVEKRSPVTTFQQTLDRLHGLQAPRMFEAFCLHTVAAPSEMSDRVSSMKPPALCFSSSKANALASDIPMQPVPQHKSRIENNGLFTGVCAILSVLCGIMGFDFEIACSTRTSVSARGMRVLSLTMKSSMKKPRWPVMYATGVPALRLWAMPSMRSASIEGTS